MVLIQDTVVESNPVHL